MAWTDKARAAAQESRRRNLSVKSLAKVAEGNDPSRSPVRVQPTVLYTHKGSGGVKRPLTVFPKGLYTAYRGKK